MQEDRNSADQITEVTTHQGHGDQEKGCRLDSVAQVPVAFKCIE